MHEGKLMDKISITSNQQLLSLKVFRKSLNMIQPHTNIPSKTYKEELFPLALSNLPDPIGKLFEYFNL